MNLFRQLFAGSNRIGRASSARRLNLEPLEERALLTTSSVLPLAQPSSATSSLLPLAQPSSSTSNVLSPAQPSNSGTTLVVPLSQPIDGVSTFHLLQDAVNAATPNGTIIVEPGATADPNPVNVGTYGLTIIGAPNASSSVLPSYDISINAGNATLTHMNLGTVTIGTDFGGVDVNHSLVNTIDVNGGFTGIGNLLIDQNAITGSVSIVGAVSNPMENVSITNNTINSVIPASTGPIFNLQDVSGALVQNNTITGGGSAPQIGMQITRGVNDLITNNTITLSGANLSTDGILVENPGSNSYMTTEICNNTLATGQGCGLFISASNDANMQASVQGNAFQNNAIGVEYLGSGGNIIPTDLGGGGNALGTSLGGNDFRGFPAQGTTATAAIVMENVAAPGVLAAQANIFTNPAAAQQAVVVAGGAGTINVSNALDANHAYVQTLFNQVLGYTGTMGDLNYWVNILTASPQGRAEVASGIATSQAGLGRLINNYYLQFLGRPVDPAGLTYWLNQFAQGASIEEVQAAILSSQEFISDNSSDYVNAVYQVELARPAGPNGLAYWSGILATQGFTGVALGITTSAEFRKDFIVSLFQQYLHHAPGASAMAYWLAQPGDLMSLETQLLATDAYFNNG